MLKKWICHKVVSAARIDSIKDVSPTLTRLWLAPEHSPDNAVVMVDLDYMHKHRPQAGGYYVEYEDGYKSFSPAKPFESGYSQVDPAAPMSIGGALDAMREGKKVARHGWNGKGMWLLMQKPDAHSKMTLPYIYIEYPEGHPAYPKGSRVPWLASQTDLLAADWIVVE